jgi:hypothetical protein
MLNKKLKLKKRNEEREISEKIALNQLQKGSISTEQIDERLYSYSDKNKTKGFEDDNLFDQPLLQGSSANQIYRPSKSSMESYGLSNNQTIQFEKDKKEEKIEKEEKKVKEEKDPFDFGQFFSESKNTKKRSYDNYSNNNVMSISSGGTGGDLSGGGGNKRKKIQFEKPKNN